MYIGLLIWALVTAFLLLFFAGANSEEWEEEEE